MSESEVQVKLHRLLGQHANEWKNFMHSLGQDSFLADWAIYGNA
jgi:hypothetical protein